MQTGKYWKGQTRYRLEGHKILKPMSDEQFNDGMTHGHFVKSEHRAYCVLLFYSAVRKTEGCGERLKKEAFTITEDSIYFDVGKRLKHSTTVEAIPLSLNAPYMDLLKKQIEQTEAGKPVFDFCPKTAYNVVRRAFKYPHLFRLTRITTFLLKGFTIPEIHSWTGLSVSALNYYVGLVSTARMGESLAKKKDA